jgi:hypothetical protein
MNRKQFLILLVLVLLLGGAGLIIHQRGSRSWEDSASTLGGKLLPNLPVNDIAQITLQAGTNQLHLVRTDNRWRVYERGNYPANFSQISDWILKLADLKIAQNQDVGPSQLARFALLPPGPATNTATLVELADANGKTLASLLLGKKHLKKSTGAQPMMGLGDQAWPDGRYVMVGANRTTLDVIADPLDNAEPKPDQWLSKDFLNVENPSAITVAFPEATNSWQLTRASETNDWQLAAAGPKEKLDADKISGVTSPLSSASFNDVLPPDIKPEAAGLTNLTRLTVATFDGFTYTAQIGPKQAENYPVAVTVTAVLPPEPAPAVAAQPAAPAKSVTEAKPSADKVAADKAVAEAKEHRKTLTDKLAREQQCEHWTYLMPAYALDAVLKPRTELLVTETNTPSAPLPPESK